MRASVVWLADAMRDHARLSENPDSSVRSVARAFELADLGWLPDSALIAYGGVRSELGWRQWLDKQLEALRDLWKQYRSGLASLLVISSLRAGPYAGMVTIDLPNGLGAVLRPFHRDLWDVRHWAGLKGHTTWIAGSKVPFIVVTAVATTDLALAGPEIVRDVATIVSSAESVARKLGESFSLVLARLTPIAAGWSAGMLTAFAGMKAGAALGGIVGSAPGLIAGAIIGGLAGLGGYYLAKWGTSEAIARWRLQDRVASWVEAELEQAGAAVAALDASLRSSVDTVGGWIDGVSRSMRSRLTEELAAFGHSCKELDSSLRSIVESATQRVAEGMHALGDAGRRVGVSVTQTLAQGRDAVDGILRSAISSVSQCISGESSSASPEPNPAADIGAAPGTGTSAQDSTGGQTREPEAESPMRGEQGDARQDTSSLSSDPAMQSPWRQVSAPVRNTPGQRSAQAYADVIDQFDVEHSFDARYGRGGAGNDDTRCNIFAGDVMRAMGAPLPTKGDLGMGHGASKNTDPMTATARQLFGWLEEERDGWRRIDTSDPEDLRILAEHLRGGRPAVAADSGHIAVLRPEGVPEALTVANLDELRIAQAGAVRMNDVVLNGAGYGTLFCPFFYIHD